MEKKIMTDSRITTGLCLIAIVFFSSEAFSSETYIQNSKNYLLASNDLISAEQASNIAKQGKDSKVLKISKKSEGNREYYRIKLLSSKGHVQIILVDARSGAIIQENQ
jgi:uncharacterized membrane protein YkoI